MNALCIAIFVLGIVSWFYTRSRVFGRYFPVLVFVFGLSNAALATDRPAGFADVYRVRLGGGSVPSSLGLATGPEGVADMPWDQSRAMWFYMDVQRSPAPISFDKTPWANAFVYLQQVDPNVVVAGLGSGYLWHCEVVRDGTTRANWYSKGAKPDDGPWEVDYGHTKYYQDPIMSDRAVLSTWAGLPVLSVTPPIPGTSYSQGQTYKLQIRWCADDTLWQTSDGTPCAPSAILQEKQFWQAATPGANAANNGGSSYPQIFVGWDSATITAFEGWMAPEYCGIANGSYAADNVILYAYDMTVGSYKLYPALTSPNPDPSYDHAAYMGPWWSSNRIPPGSLAGQQMGYDLQNYGGYWLGAIDMCEVEYQTVPAKWGYKFRTSASQINDEQGWTTKNLPMCRAKSGGKTERWVFVISTEPGTNKPYCEVRKASGERVRLYARGNTTGEMSPFAYESDGKTVKSQLAGGVLNGRGITGVWLANPWYFYNGSDQPAFPGFFGDQGATFDPGKSLPNRVADWIDGAPDSSGNKTQPSLSDRTADAAKSTTRPSYVAPIDAYGSTWIPSASENQAFGDFSDFLHGWNLGSADAAVGPASNHWGSMQELLAIVFHGPGFVQAYWPEAFVLIRIITGSIIVYFTFKYVMAQYAWAVGFQSPERVLPPDPPLLAELADHVMGESTKEEMNRGRYYM